MSVWSAEEVQRAEQRGAVAGLLAQEGLAAEHFGDLVDDRPDRFYEDARPHAYRAARVLEDGGASPQAHSAAAVFLHGAESGPMA